VRFNLHGIFERAGWNCDGLQANNGGMASDVSLLVATVAIHVVTEIQSRPVELLKRCADLHRKPNDLIGNQLLLQRGTGI